MSTQKTIEQDRQAGRLEQMCPDCGRWEAAGFVCSWCGRPMVEVVYGNQDLIERQARMPKTAPTNPPSEYDSPSTWPEGWGPFPRPAGACQTPLKDPLSKRVA
jgi:hypothetical protein